MRGEEEEQEILLINSVNVLLACRINRTAREGCRRAGDSQPMENPAVVCPLLVQAADSPPDRPPFPPFLGAHLDWERLGRMFLCRAGTLPWSQPAPSSPSSLLRRASHKQLSQATQ